MPPRKRAKCDSAGPSSKLKESQPREPPASLALARILAEPAPAPTGLSLLESLPDAILDKVIRLVGLDKAWEACRLALVSRRIASALLGVVWPIIGIHPPHHDLEALDLQLPPDFRIDAWGERARGGSLLASELAVDAWTSEPRAPGPSVAESVLKMARSLGGLQRVSLCHADVAAVPPRPPRRNWGSVRKPVPPKPPSAAAVVRGVAPRHAYAAALASALAERSASTLVELRIDLNIPDRTFAFAAPTGATLEALLAGLRGLPALRRLDLAGYCDADGPFVAALAGAAPALTSLGLCAPAPIDDEEGEEEKEERGEEAGYWSPTLKVVEAVAEMYPSLEELRLAGRKSADTFELREGLGEAAMRTVGRLRCLRRLQLDLPLADSSLAALVEAVGERGTLEALSLSGPLAARRPCAREYHVPSLAPLQRLGSLRSLALADGDGYVLSEAPADEELAALGRLRELAVGLAPAAGDEGQTLALGRLWGLERLRVRLEGSTGGVASGLAGLAAALPALPALRDLSLSLHPVASWAPAAPGPDPVSERAAGLLRAARGALVSYRRTALGPKPPAPSSPRWPPAAACATPASSAAPARRRRL
eukprot:tig00021569_g22347.t1